MAIKTSAIIRAAKHPRYCVSRDYHIGRIDVIERLLLLSWWFCFDYSVMRIRSLSSYDRAYLLRVFISQFAIITCRNATRNRYLCVTTTQKSSLSIRRIIRWKAQKETRTRLFSICFVKVSRGNYHIFPH